MLEPNQNFLASMCILFPKSILLRSNIIPFLSYLQPDFSQYLLMLVIKYSDSLFHWNTLICTVECPTRTHLLQKWWTLNFLKASCFCRRDTSEKYVIWLNKTVAGWSSMVSYTEHTRWSNSQLWGNLVHSYEITPIGLRTYVRYFQ